MTADFTAQYKVGDSDQRPWGSYVVTGVGYNSANEEFCTKDITVRAGGILSLQSHDQRREKWTVRSGELTVVLDNKLLTLAAGQSIDIPLGAIHCMANLSSSECVVEEIQEGVCREADIKRYADASKRKADAALTGIAVESAKLYQQLVEKLSAA